MAEKSWQEILIEEISSQSNTDFLIKYTSTQLAEILDKNGNTALHIACAYGKGATVKAIINEIWDGVSEVAAIVNKEGLTTLHLAIRSRTETIVDMLMEALVHPDKCEVLVSQADDGSTVLHDAISYGVTPATVSKMINALSPEEARSISNLPNKKGQTPLHLAIRYGISGMQYLIISVLGSEYMMILESLSKEEKEKIKDVIPSVIRSYLFRLLQVGGKELSNGQKALCIQQKETLKTLLFEFFSHDEITLRRAINKNEQLGKIFWSSTLSTIPKEVAEIQQHLVGFREVKSWQKTLIAEIKLNLSNTDFLKKYTSSQLTKALDTSGKTALHIACRYGTQAIVEAIIDVLGPNIRWVVFESWSTALHLAMQYGTETIVQALIKLLGPEKTFEAAFHYNSYGKKSALQLAIEYKKETSFGKLLESFDSAIKTNNVIAKNAQKIIYTILHSIGFGTAVVAQSLINLIGTQKARRLIACPNENGWTPLHSAAEYGTSGAVQLMLETLGQNRGREVAALQNEEGDTPLHLALFSTESSEAKVNLLIKALGKEVAKRILSLFDERGNNMLHRLVNLGDVVNLRALLNVLDSSKVCKMIVLQNRNGDTPLHLALLTDPVFGEAKANIMIAQLSSVTIFPVAVLQNRKGETLSRLAIRKGADIFIQTIIERLGIKYSEVFDLCNGLTPDKKQKIIARVIKSYLDQLVCGKVLSDAQNTLCVQQKNILKEHLLDLYFQDEALLKRALDKNDPLGRILWSQEKTTTLLFRRPAPPKEIVEIRQCLNCLQKAKEETVVKENSTAHEMFENVFNNGAGL